MAAAERTRFEWDGYEAAIDDTLSEQRAALDEIAETRQAQPRWGWFSWR